MLKVHLDLLLQFDMAADGSLQLLRLHLQRGIAVDAYKIFSDQLDEVLHQMISQQRLGSRHFWVLVKFGQISEIILGWKHGFESIEYQILSLLGDQFAVVLGRCEQGLKLLDHYKEWICMYVEGEGMRKHTKQGYHGHQRSIFRLLLQLLVELDARLPLNFSSLNLLKKFKGQVSFIALSDFSQFSISGILLTRSLRACNFFNFLISSGNIFSSRLTASQAAKSRMVIQGKNQGLSVHYFSQMTRMGLILFSQQYSMHFLFSSSQVGLETHFIAIIAVLRSVLLRMLSTLALSSMVRPKRSGLSAFSAMQVAIARGPVTQKSPSWRKGRSFMTQDLASFSLNLFHWSGSKKRSRYGR